MLILHQLCHARLHVYLILRSRVVNSSSVYFVWKRQGRSSPTAKSSDIVVLNVVVNGVWLSLHVRFVNTGVVLSYTSSVCY